MRTLTSLLLALPVTALTAPAPAVPDNAVAVGAILDDKVLTEDERDIGELEDVLLTMDGALEEYLIDFDEPDDNYNRGATTFRDDVANYDEAPLYEDESVEGELQMDLVAARPDQVDLQQRESDAVIVNPGPDGVSALAPRDERRFAEREYVRASVIVGTDVNLVDEESFGSVEDILLSPAGDEIVAYVIDSWDGLDKRRHAVSPTHVSFVPADRDAAIREDFGITGVKVDLAREQIEALPEVDLDRYSEDVLDR